jgi:uncharacterized protein DUF6941
MRLDLFVLARYAEAQGDLLNILSAGWDSITVTETPEGLPDGAVAVAAGVLAARVQFHQITETNREHKFSIALVDEDGGEMGRFGGEFPLERKADIPAAWPQHMNIVLPLGIPLPRFGTYRFAIEVDGTHLGELSFRVVDGRAGEEAEAA